MTVLYVFQVKYVFIIYLINIRYPDEKKLNIHLSLALFIKGILSVLIGVKKNMAPITSNMGSKQVVVINFLIF